MFDGRVKYEIASGTLGTKTSAVSILVWYCIRKEIGTPAFFIKTFGSSSQFRTYMSSRSDEEAVQHGNGLDYAWNEFDTCTLDIAQVHAWFEYGCDFDNYP